MRAVLLALVSLPAFAVELRVVDARTDSGLDAAAVKKLVTSKLPELVRCISVETLGEAPPRPTLTLYVTSSGALEPRTFADYPLSPLCVRELSRGWSLPKMKAPATAVVTLDAKTTAADHVAARSAVRRDLTNVCGGLKGSQGTSVERLRSTVERALANGDIGFEVRAALSDAKRRLAGAVPDEGARDLKGPAFALNDLADAARFRAFCPELTELSLELLVPKPAIDSAKLAGLLGNASKNLEACISLAPTDDEEGRLVIRIGSTKEGRVADLESVSAQLREDCVREWLEPLSLPPTPASALDVGGSSLPSRIDRVRDAAALAGTSRVTLRYAITRAKRDELRAATEAGFEDLCEALARPDARKALTALAGQPTRPRAVREVTTTLLNVEPADGKLILGDLASAYELAGKGPCLGKLRAAAARP